AYLAIRWYGEGLTSSGAALAGKSQAGSAPTSADVMLHVLLALIVVIVLARSVLGRVAPGVAAYVLPTSVAPFLNVIAQIGVILYMFMVGLELDPKLLRNRGHATVAISHASILAPFLMGA